MKKTSLLLIALFVTTGAFADEADKSKNLTLAATEASAKAAWIETEEDAELRLNEELTEKAEVLNAEINAKLEKQLEAKLSKEFGI
jgi:hypothetical protein